MDAVVSKRPPTREFCCSQRRHLRRNITNFSDSNHRNFFMTPLSNYYNHSSSSAFHRQQRPHFVFHPFPPMNRQRKLGRTSTKGDMNASKRLKTSSGGRESVGPSTATESLIITSTDRLGPDPSEISRVLKSPPFSTPADDDERFSGSVCALSPPPSSLPLPNFSMAPKIGCKAEAGGIDIQATNGLRCLLGL